MHVIAGNQSTIISEYAARRLIRLGTAEVVKRARLVMPNNPCWQGWVTELECLHKFHTLDSISLFDTDGNEEIWVNANSNTSAQMYIEVEELINPSSGTSYISQAWNENTADAIHVAPDNKIRIIQITESLSRHVYKNTDI